MHRGQQTLDPQESTVAPPLDSLPEVWLSNHFTHRISSLQESLEWGRPRVD